MKKIVFLFVAFIGFNAVEAEIRLPAIIGTHMVLQQNSMVNMWGGCEPGEKIKITTNWDTTTYNTVGTYWAKWSLPLKTPARGGPYTITIQGSNRIVLEDVLIGEVWACSGQSNMEMSYNWGKPNKFDKDVTSATNTNIRFFNIPKQTALYPQEDVKARWVVCTPDEMKKFSLVGYFFGQKLQQDLKSPVGLINASWGGTPAEAWTPKELVEQDFALTKAASTLKALYSWPVTPGAAYNAMIYPLINYNITGVIWYQGESNTGTADTYQSLFTTMIGAWRKVWEKEFPFYFVQIAPYTYGNNNIGALLREAQTKTLSYPKTGMVVTSDLVDNIKDIHPRMKKEVGLRLANLALADTYKKRIAGYNSPIYKNMKIEKDKIRVYFDHAEDGLVTKGGTPTDFYIAGEDKNFEPAQAMIEGNAVVVWSNTIKSPVAVRFGFNNIAMPNLYSTSGLPVNLFRTDDWPVNTDAVK